MREWSRVLVVGAGPAGASLAYLLASRGVEVTLLERQSDFAREFRGEVMTPGGVRALGEMGLREALADLPHQDPTSFGLYFDRREAFHTDSPAALFDGELPLIVSQPHLLEMLAERAAAFPGFELARGVSVRGLLEEAGRVVGVRCVGPEGEREVRADLVVGADGRASVVRRAGGFRAEPRDQPMDIVWCKLPWPSFWEGQRPVRAFLGGGHLLIALPAPDGLLQVAWVILKGTFRELRAAGIEEWVGDMADHASPELAAHLRANIEGITRPFLLDVHVDAVHGWSRPGVLLLGDAAHTMSPVGAQGINLALRDAIVAANHLVPALREGAKGAELDAAAARVEAERGPEIDRIQALAAQPPKVVMSRGLGPRLLRAIAPLAFRLPFLGRAVKPLRDDFLFGTCPVELRV